MAHLSKDSRLQFLEPTEKLTSSGSSCHLPSVDGLFGRLWPGAWKLRTGAALALKRATRTYEKTFVLTETKDPLYPIVSKPVFDSLPPVHSVSKTLESLPVLIAKRGELSFEAWSVELWNWRLPFLELGQSHHCHATTKCRAVQHARISASKRQSHLEPWSNTRAQ